MEQALRKRQLFAVLLWNIVGLLWQSLAIWILTNSVLHLPIGKWYVLAGAYCLAWTMGFSVGFLTPGGMGVPSLCSLLVASCQLLVALLFDFGEEGLAVAEFVAWRQGIGHQIGESAAFWVDIELGEAFGGFVRQNGQEADQRAIDGTGRRG